MCGPDFNAPPYKVSNIVKQIFQKFPQAKFHFLYRSKYLKDFSNSRILRSELRVFAEVETKRGVKFRIDTVARA